MGSLDKLCLRWNDFDKNVSKSFASIRDQSQFFDCTLATDDDTDYLDNLRAHKVILSACSEFFRNILTKESIYAHPNPLLYLRGISAKDLMHVLDFMYLGEVNVAKEELDKFLEVADTLKIKGLTQRSNDNSSKKRPAHSQVSTSLLPGDLYKKPKLHFTRTHSASRSMADPDDLLKTESDLLVPLGGGENDDGNDHNEKCDEDNFDGDYEGNVVQNDHQFVSDGEQYAEIINFEDPIRTCKNHKRQGKKSPSQPPAEPITNTEDDIAVAPSLPKTTELEIPLKTQSNHVVSNVSEDLKESTGCSSNSAGDAHDVQDDLKANYESKYNEESNQATGPNAEVEHVQGNEQKSYKGKHLSEAERTTLVNLIKTLDNDDLLKSNGSMQRGPETAAKRKALWNKIVLAFNEICGTNCDKSKLKNTLNRIKHAPQWKSHSILYDLGE